MTQVDVTQGIKNLYEFNFDIKGHEPDFDWLEAKAEDFSKLDYSVNADELREYFKSKTVWGVFYLSFVAPYFREIAEILLEYRGNIDPDKEFYVGKGLFRSPHHREVGLQILLDLIDSYLAGKSWQLDLSLYSELRDEPELDKIEGISTLKEKIRTMKRK